MIYFILFLFINLFLTHFRECSHLFSSAFVFRDWINLWSEQHNLFLWRWSFHVNNCLMVSFTKTFDWWSLNVAHNSNRKISNEIEKLTEILNVLEIDRRVLHDGFSFQFFFLFRIVYPNLSMTVKLFDIWFHKHSNVGSSGYSIWKTIDLLSKI